ncbi:hypothetical protein, partial [Acinetobacter lactucae]|uniref:hypothetical protein n=1 Tax=Acinetobacter lactucae TaxID=1785128 RepID=UPI0015806793
YVDGNISYSKQWVKGLPEKSDSILIKGNTNKAGFVQQQIPFTPTLYVGGVALSVTESQCFYEVDENYINVSMFVTISKDTIGTNTGDIDFSLPTNSYLFENSAISISIAGFGSVQQAIGFTKAPANLIVNRTTMRLQMYDALGVSIKTSDLNSAIANYLLALNYKAKVRV